MSSTTIKKYKRDTDVKIEWCKTICLGKIAWRGYRKINSVEIETTLVYNKKQNRYTFTSSAEVWNATHTDVVAGGQCLDEIWKYTRIKPFNDVYKWWKVYHLNDMHAGTPEQDEYLKNFLNKDYTERCNLLKEVGLYEVNYEGKPYKYGTAWLYRPIPEADLKAIIKYLEEE